MVFAEQHQIGGGEILAAHLDAEALDAIVALPQSGCIDEPERKAFEDPVRLDRVPGRTRNLGHDGALPTEQRVEQG